jgi:hypothetical protein
LELIIYLFFYGIIKATNNGRRTVNTNQKPSLESKLSVYRFCYQKAESQKDHKRMDKIGIIIDELLEQIAGLD